MTTFIAMGGASRIIEGVFTQGGERLDRALADATGLSRERIKALIGQAAITVDGRAIRSASGKTYPGAVYAITVPDLAEPDARPQAIPLDVVYEDDDLIVIDKPAGMVVHPAAGNPDGTLVNALLHHCQGRLSGINGVARPGIVHRIDKDTSGLLVAAKTDRAHEGLARQFADHSIERAYLAVCAGRPQPPAGTVTGRIGRSEANRQKMAITGANDDAHARGKIAVTHFRTLQPLISAALIECRLETGRTHQVRVHLASIGHPLLGDPVYGRSPTAIRPILSDLHFRRQALHAAILGFRHPISDELRQFSSPVAPDMRELIAALTISIPNG